MENSPLGRSNLSKEKIDVLEALSKYKEETGYDDSPDIYVREDKEKEIDLLWQNFKIDPKSVKSPSVYLAIGFIAGALFMLLLTTIINSQPQTTENKTTTKQEQQEHLKIGSESSSQESKTYTVQNGDTIESITIKSYGSFDSQKIEAIKNANNLTDINKLQIGQKLIIPME